MSRHDLAGGYYVTPKEYQELKRQSKPVLLFQY
jgi:hypothetical protein